MNLQDIANAHASKQEETTTTEETTQEVSSQENNENSSLNTETVTEQQTSEPVQESQTEVTSESNEEAQATEVEATTESSSEEVTTQAEATTEEEGLTPDEFVDYILSETEGNDELRDSILNKFGVAKDPFANEQIAQLNKFTQETGRGLEDYLFINSLDTENMDSKSAVIQNLALDNPELNADELQVLFEDTYKLDEDEYSEKEIKASKVKLKVDGKNAINRLNTLKSEWQKPTIKSPQQNESPALLPENFADAYASEIDSVGSFEIDLNDKGEKFEFTIPDEYGSSVEKFNTQDPFARYRDANGQIDAYAMAEREALWDNFQNIAKAIYQHATSQAMEKAVVEKKNLTLNQENRPPAAETKQTKQQQQIASVMKDFL